jgi:hypothetical protein
MMRRSKSGFIRYDRAAVMLQLADFVCAHHRTRREIRVQERYSAAEGDQESHLFKSDCSYRARTRRASDTLAV